MKVDFQGPLRPPAGARDILLVRHGSADPPAPDGLINGRSDPPLNARGREQAAAVARRLAGEPVAAVFSTPLVRAAQTAAAVGAEHGIAPVVLEQFNEIYLGEWEGHGIHARGAAADPEFVAMMSAQRWDVIPGAEPTDVFAARVRAGIEAIADAGADGAPTVAVTHAGVIAEVLRQITGSQPFAFLLSANGSISRVMRLPGGRWQLLAFNDTAHLPAG